MKILLIGNGFDLEHGLPTKYTEFLTFIVQFQEKYIELKRKYIKVTDIEMLIIGDI